MNDVYKLRPEYLPQKHEEHMVKIRKDNHQIIESQLPKPKGLGLHLGALFESA